MEGDNGSKEVVNSVLFWGLAIPAATLEAANNAFNAGVEVMQDGVKRVGNSRTFAEVKGVAENVGLAAMALTDVPFRVMGSDEVRIRDVLFDTADKVSDNLKSAGAGIGKATGYVRNAVEKRLQALSDAVTEKPGL